MKDISVQAYYAQYNNLAIIDVRSPGEFEKGHILGAINIPLFSNDERAHVGTVYKQQSKEKAIELGYTYVNPKLQWFIDESVKVAPNKNVVVHCWRGGMRSHSFAKHLEENGFTDVKVLDKGYKGFRNYVLDSFDTPVDLIVIGGYTGSGKTHMLKCMKELGCQIIDLEGVANHKGSAFGAIGEKEQPTIEQFENNLFMHWKAIDFSNPVYIEDESHNIGRVKLPMNLYTKIREAVVYFVEVPKEKRAKVLVDDYAGYNNELLKEGIIKISKRLGGYVTKLALKALEEEDYFKVAMFTLNYYDKSYMNGVLRRDRDKIVKLELLDANAGENARYVKEFVEKHKLVEVIKN